MTLPFDEPQEGEVRTIDGRECRWIAPDMFDPDGRWQPTLQRREPLKGHPNEMGRCDILPGDILHHGLPEDGRGRGRSKPISHGPRTKAWLEKQGFRVEKSETAKVVYGGAIIKNDLFGIADWVAVKPPLLVWVQDCAEGQLMAHLRKFRDIDFTRLLLRCNTPIWVVSWAKPDRVWVPKVTEVTEELMDKFDSRKRAS